MLEEFVRNIYYLKYTFKDNFPYSFWNPNSNLSQAIIHLKENPKPIKMHSDEEIKQYQLFIRAMYYLSYSIDQKSTKFYLENAMWQILSAKQILPNEIWSDYWLLTMNYKINNYKTAYEYSLSLLANELTYSSICLPEILKMHNKSAQEIGEKSEQIINTKALFNELNIDVTKLHLFFN